MIEFNQDVLIIAYSILLLIMNVGYLKDYRVIKEGLNEMSSNDLLIKNEDITISLLALAFSFIKSWLVYLIAFAITEWLVIVIILGVFIIMDTYDSLFNFKIEKLRKSKIGLFRTVSDTVFILCFTLYYLLILI